jgi:hypothetical protein
VAIRLVGTVAAESAPVAPITISKRKAQMKNLKQWTKCSVISLAMVAGCSFEQPDSTEGSDQAKNEQSPEAADRSKAVGAEKDRALLSTLFDQADVAFEGQVIAIDYRLSGAAGDAERTPHTFVTYRVLTPFKHSQRDETITLRFFGGPNDDGTITLSSITPRINLGDHDVMFVKDNGKSAVPLVQGRAGRLRVLDDRMFADSGRSLSLDKTRGALRAGPVVDHPALNTHRVGTALLTLKRSATPDSAMAMTVATSRHDLVDFLSSQHSPTGLAGDFSVDASASFTIESF